VAEDERREAVSSRDGANAAARQPTGPALDRGMLRKRSLVVAGHGTSLALEPEFWAALEALAARRSISLAALIGQIDGARGARPLASACRVAALAAASGVHM
jgi:predicted DNA-binding ribbon-helix-helix protein